MLFLQLKEMETFYPRKTNFFTTTMGNLLTLKAAILLLLCYSLEFLGVYMKRRKIAPGLSSALDQGVLSF